MVLEKNKDEQTVSKSVISKHYHQEKVKKIIQNFSNFQGSHKSGKYDQKGLYDYQNNQRRLLDFNNPDDYEIIVSKSERIILGTLNYFNPALFQSWHPKSDISPGGYVETDYFMLSVDIDLTADNAVQNSEARHALEIASEFFYHKLSDLTNGKLLVMFSGNGIYIHLHPHLGHFSNKIQDHEREDKYEALIQAFNLHIQKLEREMYQQHPWIQEFVKIDALNNRKRYFKAPLSLHGSLPYVVYPLNPYKNFELPIKQLTLSETDLIEAEDLITNFMNFEVVGEDHKKLGRVLTDYLDQIVISRKEYRNLDIDNPIEAIPIEIIESEPVTAAIFRPERWEKGNTRRIAYMASTLALSGWDDDSIKAFISDRASEWGINSLNHVIESWIGMYPPNNNTIYRKGGSYPNMYFGDCLEHLPKKPKYHYNITRIYTLARENEHDIPLSLFGLKDYFDKYGHDTKKGLKETAKYLMQKFNLHRDSIMGELYIYNKEKQFYTHHTPMEFVKWLSTQFEQIYYEDEAKKIISAISIIKEPDYHIIAFKNKYFNMRTFKVIKPTPELFSVIKIPYDYNPNAKPGKMENTLREILSDDDPEDKYTFFLETVGYGFAEGNKHHLIILWVGIPGAGKTVLITLIKSIFINSYSAVPLKDFSQRFGLANVINKAVNFLYDMSTSKIEDPGTIKAATGQDPITVDRKYKDPIETVIKAKQYGTANELPEITDDSKAMFQRIRIVELKNQFRGTDKENSNLLEELTEDTEAIEWLIYQSIMAYQNVRDSGIWTIEQEEEYVEQEYLKKANPALFGAKALLVKTNDERDFYTTGELIDLISEYLKTQDCKIPANNNYYHKAIQEIGGEKATRKIAEVDTRGYCMIVPKNSASDPKVNRIDKNTKIKLSQQIIKDDVDDMGRVDEALHKTIAETLDGYKGLTAKNIYDSMEEEYNIKKNKALKALKRFQANEWIIVDNEL